MKIVFMGTPDFAVPCLSRLLQEGHEVSLVVTREDKPKGRGHKLTPPPVKEFAVSRNLPVFQPATLKPDDVYERLKAEQADVFVVVAYGRILPARVLELPRYGCVNIHASLLPRYRGAAPIQWAVLNGDDQTGVTAMQMDVGVDTGDMLLSQTVPISRDMTAGELHDILSEAGASVLAKALTDMERGALVPRRQENEKASYAPMLDKSLSPLDFHKTAIQLHNQVRGLNPWPVATCEIGGKLLKIYRTELGEPCSAPAGCIIKLNPLTVACGQGDSLILREVQPQGGRRMTAEEFLRGHALAVGTLLV